MLKSRQSPQLSGVSHKQGKTDNTVSNEILRLKVGSQSMALIYNADPRRRTQQCSVRCNQRPEHHAAIITDAFLPLSMGRLTKNSRNYQNECIQFSGFIPIFRVSVNYNTGTKSKRAVCSTR